MPFTVEACLTAPTPARQVVVAGGMGDSCLGGLTVFAMSSSWSDPFDVGPFGVKPTGGLLRRPVLVLRPSDDAADQVRQLLYHGVLLQELRERRLDMAGSLAGLLSAVAFLSLCGMGFAVLTGISIGAIWFVVALGVMAVTIVVAVHLWLSTIDGQSPADVVRSAVAAVGGAAGLPAVLFSDDGTRVSAAYGLPASELLEPYVAALQPVFTDTEADTFRKLLSEGFVGSVGDLVTVVRQLNR